MQRARRDFRKLADDFHKGKATLADARKRVASFIAYVKHCNAHQTTSELLDEFILIKPNGENHAQN